MQQEFPRFAPIFREEIPVPPVAGVVEEMFPVAGPFADVFDGGLVVEGEVGLGFQGSEGEDLGEHHHGPVVDAEDQHPCVETVFVLGAEDVDVVEAVGWEEEGPGDRGVHDYAIAVEPSVGASKIGC